MIHVGVLGFAHGHVMGYGTNMQNHHEWGVKITGGWDHDAQRAKDSCEKLGATAFATAEELLASDIQAVIVKNGGPYMESIHLFDIYQGKQVPDGFKSMAYSLTFRSSEETLTDNSIEDCINAIINGLKEKLNCTLR